MENLEQFRAETREWLEANCPEDMRQPMRSDEDQCWGGRNWVFKSEGQKLWLERMAAKGWTAPRWPTEYGGGGLSGSEAKILGEEMARIGARRPLSSFGLDMLGPALLRYATEEQKQQYIPDIINGKIRWCQGYSEPNAGSDLASLRTKAEDMGDHYLLNGAKMWITNGTIADVAIVWAKLDGVIRGFIVEKDDEGFSAPEMKGKHSLKASVTSELVFQDCKIPKDRILPGVKGLRGPFSCLNNARYGISWGALGAAMACFHSAKTYALSRIQFDHPIASYQLVQNKLAWMLREITKGQLLAYHLGRKKDDGSWFNEQISLAKMNNVDIALEIARVSRDIHGANGILDEYPVMRHMANLESVKTYEGTHDIHNLILGRYITGIQAFTRTV